MFFRYLPFILLALTLSHNSYARQSCDWPFRTTITINETSGSTTSNYRLKLTLSGDAGGTLNAGYNWSSDGADLRIFSSNDTTPLPFSIASWDQANKIAEVWVTFATFNANSSNTLYVYYGNNAVATADGGAPPTITYVNDKIKFHTRNNTTDPASFNQAKSLFDSKDDSNTRYGCSHPNQYSGIRNATQHPGGATVNFIAYSTALFTVPTAGTWGVRYGADYGLGGALYINGTPLDERWNEDLWWGGSDWNNPDVLSGTRFLTAGEHKLEVIGAEGGNDGGLTIQFYRGSTNQWAQDATTLGISIRSESCPVIRHTIQYGAHETCGVDLSVQNPVIINTDWIAESENNITYQAKFESSTPTGISSSNPTRLNIQLPNGVTLINGAFNGSNWSCAGTSGLVQCLYSGLMSGSAPLSSVLTLFTKLDASIAVNSNISIVATVSGDLADPQSNNNINTVNISITDNTGLDPSCSNPQPGVWTRYFDTSGSSVATDAPEYQTLVDTYVNSNKLFGQTILENINGSGNPFDPNYDAISNPTPDSDNFMAIFQAYIYIPTRDTYYFSVDGDDSIEAWVDGSIISTFYGAHAQSGTPTDKTRIRNLSAGFHKIEFRMQEITGQDAYDFYWSTNRNGGDTIIPASAYYQCAGNTNIEITSQLEVLSDDINGGTLAKAIPNSIIKYTVTGRNKGNISTDNGSTIITQKIDDNNEFYVKDLNGTGEGPVHFIDGSNPSDSGLRYSYNAASGLNDSLWFSSNGITFTESTDLSNDYNSAITHFQIRFDGSLKASLDTAEPYFTFEYQVRVK